jgi:hypothetical protein
MFCQGRIDEATEVDSSHDCATTLRTDRKNDTVKDLAGSLRVNLAMLRLRSEQVLVSSIFPTRICRTQSR